MDNLSPQVSEEPAAQLGLEHVTAGNEVLTELSTPEIALDVRLAREKRDFLGELLEDYRTTVGPIYEQYAEIAERVGNDPDLARAALDDLDQALAPSMAQVISSTPDLSLEVHKERYQREFKQEFEILKEFGVHPDGNSGFTNAFSRSAEVLPCGANIGEHSVAVGRVAEIIGTALKDAGVVKSNGEVVSDEDVREWTRNALLHDALKLYEIMWEQASQAGEMKAEFEKMDKTQAVAVFLVRDGHKPGTVMDLVKIWEDNGFRGLNRDIQTAADGKLDLNPSDLGRTVIGLADHMVATGAPGESVEGMTLVVTPLERQLVSRQAQRYEAHLKRVYLDPSGRFYVTKGDAAPEMRELGSVVEVGVWIGEKLAEKVVDSLGVEDGRMPGEVVKELVHAVERNHQASL